MVVVNYYKERRKNKTEKRSEVFYCIISAKLCTFPRSYLVWERERERERGRGRVGDKEDEEKEGKKRKKEITRKEKRIVEDTFAYTR